MRPQYYTCTCTWAIVQDRDWPAKHGIVCTCDMCMYTVHVITQYGDGCLGGLITPAHSTVLRQSYPVYQGRDDFAFA